jgi:hypothetical protein
MKPAAMPDTSDAAVRPTRVPYSAEVSIEMALTFGASVTMGAKPAPGKNGGMLIAASSPDGNALIVCSSTASVAAAKLRMPETVGRGFEMLSTI